jgi:long-chain acyl-CoA synthetase
VKTVADIFRAAAGRKSDVFADGRGGGDRAVSAEQFRSDVRAIAAGLAATGLRLAERTAILADNGPEWLAADLAIACAGGVSVPIYSSAAPAEIAEILVSTGAVAVFAGGPEALDRLRSIRSSCPALRRLIRLDVGGPTPDGVAPLSSLVAAGVEALRRTPRVFDEQTQRIEPGDVAAIVFTPGATGAPKGVMLTHAGLVSQAQMLSESFGLGPEDALLSVVPLAHALERALEYAALVSEARICYFDPSEPLEEALGRLRPTVIAAVPRMFDALRDRILGGVEGATGSMKTLYPLGMDVAREMAERTESRKGRDPLLSFAHKMADRFVLSKLRARIGGRLRLGIAPEAPLTRETSEFFQAIGIPVQEAYGLTEAGYFVSANRGAVRQPGSVGQPLPGVAVQITTDGEVLVRGPSLMKGYWKMPAETAEALTADGWLHTGDIGYLDASGYLHVRGRKKQLLVSAKGKIVPAGEIEASLESSPYVANAVAIGDARRVVTALIVPKWSRVEAWARESSLPSASRDRLCVHPRVKNLFQQEIDRVNADQLEEHRIRKFMLLPEEFSAAEGELNPLLVVRRHVVERRQRDRIEEMYEWAAARALTKAEPAADGQAGEKPARPGRGSS